MDAPDRTLLDRFIAGHDEAAFRILVGRHLDLVHAVARRVTGSDDFARDIAQATFIRLAQRAALIPRDVSLAAWLHRTTRSLAVDLVRAETRRKKRESGTHLHESMDTSPEPNWSALAPVIDELVDALPAADRELVLAKYYHNESHASIAARLGLTEINARKRASRALEKLRSQLLRRGIATSATALATMLPAHAITPAPGALATAVISASSGITPMAPQAFSIHLAMTTAQKSAIAVAAVVFLGSLGYAIRPVAPLAAVALSSNPTTLPTGADAPPRNRILRPLPASTEDRLARLREILTLTSSTQRTRELLDFVDQLPASAFKEVADCLHSWERSVDWKECELVMSAWAKVDPMNAAEWATDHPSRVYLGIVLTCWGENDPEAALDWVKQRFPGAIEGDCKARAPWTSVLFGLAARDLGAAVKALEAIPKEENRIEALELLASRLMHTQPGAMDRLLEEVKDGPGRSRLIGQFFPSLVKREPQRAWELLLADDGARKKTNVVDEFRMWHYTDPANALAGLPQVPEGELRDDAVTGVCLASVNKDPQKAFELLWQHPGAADDGTIATMAQDCPIEHVGFGLDQALRMKDETLRNEVLTGRLTWWVSMNKAAANRWMDAHEIPAVIRDAAQSKSYDPFAR